MSVTEYKLAELRPRWMSEHSREGMGVSFECPCCAGTDSRTRIAVWFLNPIDLGPSREGENLWKRTGDDFSHLTLSPSIDASGGSKVDWHGRITDGCMVGGIQNKLSIKTHFRPERSTLKTGEHAR